MKHKNYASFINDLIDLAGHKSVMDNYTRLQELPFDLYEDFTERLSRGGDFGDILNHVIITSK